MTEQQLIQIIKKGEGETIEFKQSFNKEVVETIVAFANASGGSVLIGVRNDGQCDGVQINEESIQNWVNEVKNKTAPTLIPAVDLLQKDEKSIVVLSIKEYPIKPVATKGKYYKRVVNSNHIMSITEVVNIHLYSFNTSWDYHLNNDYSLDSISFEKVQGAINLINEDELKISSDPLTFLFKNDLVRNDKITNATFLLFTKDTTPLTTIELGRFQTPILIKDSLRSKSDILRQVEDVLSFVKKHINKEVIVTGESRHTQKWQYPIEGLREIIINMIHPVRYALSA